MIKLFIFYLLVFSLVEFIYLKIAGKKGIIDKINDRSSHNTLPIRGAGIVFPLAFMLSILLDEKQIENLPVLLGVLLISFISFMDDINSVKVRWRILFHFTSVSLILYQLDLYSKNIFIILLCYIIIIGIINAYNFMDGINGITAMYSIVSIISLYYVSETVFLLTDAGVFLSILAALFVFSFLNVRRVTKCFSGDVGSISMAFILIYFVLKLIVNTEQFVWILFFAVYGIDTVATILLRVLRRENIFQAHRSHLYQFLVNEKKIPHILIASIYGFIQLCLNVVVIKLKPDIALICFVFLIILYSTLRLTLEGKNKLFKRSVLN